MTIAEAWDILDAADAIGRAHGFECYPTIARRVIELDFVRGNRIVSVAIVEADLNACADTAAVRELVERRVVEALAARAAALGAKA